MSIERLLSTFAAKNGLTPPTARPDGSYVLVFDGRYKLAFVAEGSSSAVVRSPAGELPVDGVERREALDRLLDAATARMSKGGEILTVEEGERRLFLYRRFVTDIQPHVFEALLTSFVNSLAFWRRMAGKAGPGPVTLMPFQMMFR